MENTKSLFEQRVREFSKGFGGIVNVHIHGDRAYTRKDEYYDHIGKSVAELSSLSLPEKQRLTWALHQGKAFESDCIEERVSKLFDESIKFGVKELWTTADVTYNTKLKSFEIIEKLKEQYKDKILIKIGAYNPSGFRKDNKYKDRFELFEEAAKRSDFLIGLAEKDKANGHIGERQHNFYMLNLAYKLNKPVHFHVGQANSPNDKTAETLLKDLYEVQEIQLRVSPNEFPEVGLVHLISESSKNEKKFKEIVKQMQERQVKVICCPRAAISMLQPREMDSPIHNSIARIWDFAVAKIPIKGLGIDNLNDIYVPASSPDVYDEAEYLANSLRFYNERILAKVLCGEELDDFDRGTILKAF